MNKNIMDILANQHEDSSDDDKQTNQTSKTSKPSKKELRKERNFQRESFGVGNEKDSVRGTNKRKREGYAPKRGGRDKERYSGTGRQAFGNSTKKGGHGKGNTGYLQEEDQESNKERKPRREGNAEKEPVVEEPVKEEKIVDLDDYMKEKMINLKMKGEGQTNELQDPKMFEDENTIAVSIKKKTPVTKNWKKDDSYAMGGTVMTDNSKTRVHKRYPKKGRKKAKQLTEDDFPSLG